MFVSRGTETRGREVNPEPLIGAPRAQRLPGGHRRLDLGRRHRGAPAVAADHRNLALRADATTGMSFPAYGVAGKPPCAAQLMSPRITGGEVGAVGGIVPTMDNVVSVTQG